MTTEQIHLLSNLSANQFIELPVAEGQQVIVAAQAFLRESDLPVEIQQGFFISVYPSGQTRQEWPGSAGDQSGTDDEPTRANTQLADAEQRDTELPPAAGSVAARPEESPEPNTWNTSEGVEPDVAETEASVSLVTSETAGPDDEAAGGQTGSLAAAAAAGPLHWTDDSDDAPAESDQPIIIGIPVGGSGGH